MKRKKVFFPAVAVGTLAIAGAAWLGTAQVKAASSDVIGNILVDKIAQKFNVPKDQVQSVFDEARNEKVAAMKADQKKSLDQAVKDGVITQDQEDKIIAKMTELQAERQQKKAEMEQWLRDNSIDSFKLKQYMGKGLKNHGGKDRQTKN